MYISKIELRDWKAYESAEFNFPAPVPKENGKSGKNIVLIGAKNGFGKTSLYQAIILCLFGRDGMPLISGSIFAESENVSEQPYKEFLEEAWHNGARANGRYSCSVKIEFIGDEGPVEISRVWHFTEHGKFQIQDESVQIFKGNERQAVGPDKKPYYGPKLSHQQRIDWYRDYIAQTLMPRSIASFFVFDGEQVLVLANRDKKDQVKLGIDGLLGIPELRILVKNLTDYSKQRQNSVPKVTNESADATEKELKKLENERDKSVKAFGDISPQLSEAEDERKQIIEEFVRLGVGDQDRSKQQYERLAEHETAIKRSSEQLTKLLSEDVALALSGAKLRARLKGRLESENIRSNWESGKQQGDGRIENFLQDMDQKMDDIVPPVSDRQQVDVLDIARNSWEKLWNPPPAGCAEEYLHEYLGAHERNLVINMLNAQDSLGAAEIFDLLGSIAEHEIRRNRIRDELARIKPVQSAVNEKRKKLEELNSKIERLGKETDRLTRKRRGLDGQVDAKEKELMRMVSARDNAQPAIRRAKRARAVAAMVDGIVDKAIPTQIGRISDAMTEAYISMAHKKDLIQRIEVDTHGDVKLLDGAGRDVRGNDLSAGEKQIFTQSLLSAVSTVSNRAFPVVVDTPLSRLDQEHRKGVLEHLARRDEQVILLSTNTEVVGQYLEAIRSNISVTYLVENESDDDIRRSTVTEGYFPESKATT